MLVFIALAVAGFVLLLGGSVFGHDHEFDHDHDHGAQIDHGHDAEGGDQPVVSIFSIKVIATFIMGFGAGGAIAAYYSAGPLAASGVGAGTGFILGLLMYAVMRLIYSQQATSLVATENVKGMTGTVTVAIGKDAVGEVAVINRHYLARSSDGNPIERGRTVSVVDTVGSDLVVSERPS
jgi:membrane-bound ClpP family serine protease